MAALQVSYLRSIYNCLKNYSVIGSSCLSLDFLGFIEPISFLNNSTWYVLIMEYITHLEKWINIICQILNQIVRKFWFKGRIVDLIQENQSFD